MINFSKEELLAIYDKVKDNLTTTIKFEDYFNYVDHPELFNLETAINFEYVNRQVNMYDDMLGLYSAPERIGLFANTHLIEEACVNNKIEIFDLFKYPVRLTYGDQTHGELTTAGGNYESDLYYKTTGTSGINFKIEVKSVNDISELSRYVGKSTKTGFPYNADYLILFNRMTQDYVLVARDINYYHFTTKRSERISDVYERIDITYDLFDKNKNKLFDESGLRMKKTETFVLSKLNFNPSIPVNDVHSFKWNKELVSIASRVIDAVGIEQKHSPRKNY